MKEVARPECGRVRRRLRQSQHPIKAPNGESDARLRVIAPIVRCAATSVNPATAERDMNIPAILQREFGHNHMGVYGEVVSGGAVAVGDTLVAP